jgi:tRNA 2-thiouridine synthesizing protein B
MTTLHLISKSPAESRALERCLLRAAREDAILLTENGVYGAQRGSPALALLDSGFETGRLFVLGDDLRTRGLHPSGIIESFTIIDYADFVELAVRFPRSVSWT